MQKEKYDLVVSLGANCICSGLLRGNNLQDYSFPFDWLGGADLKTKIKLVINNFKDFFNLEDLECIGSRTNPEPCDIYKNKKTGIIFNHDFQIGIPIEKTYPLVKAKFERRENRLLNLIEKANKILFVYVESPDREIYSNQYIKEAYDLLENAYPNKEIHLKYISQLEDNQTDRQTDSLHA